MPALNRVEIIGRLGKDPETRFTPKGSKVAAAAITANNVFGAEDSISIEASNVTAFAEGEGVLMIAIE